MIQIALSWNFGITIIVVSVIAEIAYKIWAPFNARTKQHSGWKKSQSNGNLLWKIMPSSYHME